MTRLDNELHRLGFDGSGDTPVRALVLALARPADWPVLRGVWQGVQADLELPAPAIAVSGTDSYQLWFSLAQPVSLAQGQHFLQRLRLRYLHDVAPARLALLPVADALAPGQVRHAARVPARQETTGDWSAFVSPDLPAVFGEDPWLDMPPGLDAQADLLSRLKSIQPDEWAHALQRLEPAGAPAAGPAHEPLPGSTGEAPMEPRQFLLSVMNDQTARRWRCASRPRRPCCRSPTASARSEAPSALAHEVGHDGDDGHDDEDDEQQLAYARGTRGQAPEAQHGGNQGNDEKDDGVVQHGGLLVEPGRGRRGGVGRNGGPLW